MQGSGEAGNACLGERILTVPEGDDEVCSGPLFLRSRPPSAAHRSLHSPARKLSAAVAAEAGAAAGSLRTPAPAALAVILVPCR